MEETVIQPAKPYRTVVLDFVNGGPDEPVRSNLSVCAAAGACLWLASDEMATIERLTTEDGTNYGEHRSYRLADFFSLPAGPEGEMDIEGVSVDGDWLWIVGSHSLARRRPKPHDNDPEEALSRLTDIKQEANRYFLGRIRLAPTTRPDVFDLDARDAACLKMADGTNALARALGKDIHIGRFMGVPGKENGFDVEGLAVCGDRVFLGLRGPVLRGWAMVIELRIEAKKSGRLKMRRIGSSGERYCKHFLDLDGLGIRELTFDGDDLLILAGPTMDLDGPVTLHRWSAVLTGGAQKIVPQGAWLRKIMDLPYAIGRDHAEGATLLHSGDGRKEVLVVYDAPADARLHATGTAIDADIFDLAASQENRAPRPPDRQPR